MENLQGSEHFADSCKVRAFVRSRAEEFGVPRQSLTSLVLLADQELERLLPPLKRIEMLRKMDKRPSRFHEIFSVASFISGIPLVQSIIIESELQSLSEMREVFVSAAQSLPDATRDEVMNSVKEIFPSFS